VSGSVNRRRRSGEQAPMAIRTVTASLVALTALALLASLAVAAEVTRDSYRETVEPICQANTKANERILAGVRTEVKGGKLAPAAAQFARAAKALRKTQRQLAAVPSPPADQARLSKWLAKVSVEASLFEKIAAQLRLGQKSAAERTVAKLTSNADQANNLVIPFEFHYCRFEPSRFT
jgi:hypothetical protein